MFVKYRRVVIIVSLIVMLVSLCKLLNLASWTIQNALICVQLKLVMFITTNLITTSFVKTQLKENLATNILSKISYMRQLTIARLLRSLNSPLECCCAKALAMVRVLATMVCAWLNVLMRRMPISLLKAKSALPPARKQVILWVMFVKLVVPISYMKSKTRCVSASVPGIA